MKAGDLVWTAGGNLVIIVVLEKEWANIVFTKSGNLREGYPRVWLRKKK